MFIYSGDVCTFLQDVGTGKNATFVSSMSFTFWRLRWHRRNNCILWGLKCEAELVVEYFGTSMLARTSESYSKTSEVEGVQWGGHVAREDFYVEVRPTTSIALVTFCTARIFKCSMLCIQMIPWEDETWCLLDYLVISVEVLLQLELFGWLERSCGFKSCLTYSIK